MNGICGIILLMEQKKQFDKNYIKAFFLGFAVFAICVIPSMIMSDGVWIFYGDFNVQQIPFYVHAHSAIRSGNIYDFSTDLGGSLMGMYSFYLLGSPFFWLTLLFPTSVVPYLMGWISALKYAVMSLTAYAFMKPYCKKKDFALLGALLYAFSGFQGAVLVYNHFHDVMAFFPIYLILFERLVSPKENTQDSREKGRNLPFVFMTAFMLILNYYFFVGEVVFLVIYYIAKYGFDRERKFGAKIKDVLRALSSGFAGVLLSGAYILPAVYYTLGNSRLSSTLQGYDLVAYSEPTMLLGIIKNLVMLPDVSGLNSMMNQSFSRVSGVGAYIPLFSVAGVIAYCTYYKEKNWQKRVLYTCLVFAAFPVLNALFSALNSEYYARWYYMPILMMALMTANMLEDRGESTEAWKKGVFWVSAITIAITLMSILPAKTEEGVWTVLGALKNYEQLISEIVFSFVMLFLLYYYMFSLSKKSDRVTAVVVLVACLLTTATMFITGTVLVDMERKNDFIKQAVKGESPLYDTGEYYRFETDEDFYNYPLMWEDSHCITSFISTISDSTLKFYDALDVPRKVTSNLWTSRIGMRALLSSKYFVTNTMHSIEYIGHIEDMGDLKDYSFAFEKNGFKVYENENYIPMGFTFDAFVTEKDVEEAELSSTARDRLLVRALILPTELGAMAEQVISHNEIGIYQTTTINTFESACAERAATAATSFETNSRGFTAVTTLDKDNFVFFSIPYEEGFTAYVDGKERAIYKADYGFMAVLCPEGTHTIEFKYTLSGLSDGIKLSVAGLALLFLLIIISVFKAERKANTLTEIYIEEPEESLENNLEKGVD